MYFSKMSRFNLRQRPRISYYELEEPYLDEYIFCDKCGDYVYEYCSIHGALFVIPDDKVPAKSPFPPFVPRAALTVPHVFLHLAHSVIPGAGLGVFSTLTLPRGVRFGPYRGQRSTEVDSMYCWQIYDRNNKPSHVVDAADPNRSNWMRYVNCARHWCEQNLVAYQYQGQLYYRTIKIIPRFTELMVFYGSEFAHSLNIDVRRYNSPAGYAQKYGAPLKKRKPDALNENVQEESRREKSVDEEIASNIEETNLNASIPLVDSQTSTELKLKPEIEKSPELNAFNTENENSASDHVFICNDCNKRFHLKALLIEHIYWHKIKQDLYYKCGQCNYDTVTHDSLKRHMKKHDETRPHQCNECGYRFGTKSILKRHVKSLHSHCPHISTHKTDDKYSLEKHLVPSKEKSYSCHLCGLLWMKPYSCSKCPSKFASISTLKEHSLTHSAEKPYFCPTCPLKFASVKNLKRHCFTHSGEKPYSCTTCPSKFASISTLKEHSLTHSAEKPYSCPTCPSKFASVKNLKRHCFTHSGEKPYSCPTCPSKFASVKNLKRHCFTHTGEKPYSCHLCNYQSSHNSHVKRHFFIHSKTHT